MDIPYNGQIIKVGTNGQFETEDGDEYATLDGARLAIDAAMKAGPVDLTVLDEKGIPHRAKGINKGTGRMMYLDEKNTRVGYGSQAHYVDLPWVKELLEERTALMARNDQINDELFVARLASFGGRQRQDVNARFEDGHAMALRAAREHGFNSDEVKLR